MESPSEALPRPTGLPAALSLQPPEATAVNAQLSFLEDSGQVYWFLYLQVCDCYLQGDRPARARCLARFLTWGVATAAELAQALGISARTVTRARLRMQREGESSFGRPRQPRRRHGIEDPAVLARAAELLQGGASLRGVARELELCFETLRQYKREGLLPGIAAQRESGRAVVAEAAAGAGLSEPAGNLAADVPEAAGAGLESGGARGASGAGIPAEPAAGSPPGSVDKAGRNRRDAAAAMGRAARDVGGRVAASLGLLAERLPSFEATATVANGGVLTAVPALLQAGLLRHASLLHIPPGFYGLRSVLLLLAFMFLARVRNAERLRYEQPGEWGALLGLDRCPEARTLRRKLDQLAADPEALHAWRAALAGQWAADDPATAATLFVDGHVKLYSGKANLPKHFVARQKLQLPAAAGYWLNALGGAPLLCIHKQVDPKMVAEIRHGIVPQLEALGLLAPAAGAAAEPHLTLVFDREGWSPQLFRWLAAKGIACITWRKGAQTERWPDSEFRPERVTVRSPLGAAMLEAQVAERKAPLLPGCEAREVRFWIDRRLQPPGKSGQPREPVPAAGRPAAGQRQPSVITTHPSLSAAQVAGLMRSRWAQENVFKYLKEEFGLDALPQRGLLPVEPHTRVVNPAWRLIRKALDKLRNKVGNLRRKLAREKARPSAGHADKVRALHSEIDATDRCIEGLEHAARHADEHVPAGELSPEERLMALPEPLRNLLDSLRMIAYRAETAMAVAVAPELGKPENARALLQALFRSDANLVPDIRAGTLTVQLLHLASRSQDAALGPLLRELNQTRTAFPGTSLRLVYELLPDDHPTSAAPRPQLAV